MTQKVAIGVKNLSKYYPKVEALKSVSFDVREGSVHGLLGPNGAGKTTTMKILSGVIKPHTGDVFFFGRSLFENALWARSQIGFLPETPPLYLDMVVSEYLRYVGHLRRLRGKRLADHVFNCLKQCGLWDIKGRLIGNLSKGQRQRVGVAQAIVHRPLIVILDEPTAGLDPLAISEMRELITSLKNNHTVILSTHLLHEISLLAQNITIIQQGHVNATGPLEDILKRFQSRRVVEAIVDGWSEAKEKKLRELAYVHRVDIKKCDPDTSLEVHVDATSDRRGELSFKMMDIGLQIKEFKSSSPGLEDVFIELTAQKVSNGPVDSQLLGGGQ